MKFTLMIAGFVFSVLVSGFGQTKDIDYHFDQQYTMNPSGKLSLQSSDASVTVTGSKRTTARVKIDRVSTTRGISFNTKEFSVDIKEANGDLTIRENSSGNFTMIGYHSERYTINIELPFGASLSITGDDGGYEINNVDGAIQMSVDDADVSLLDCDGDDFRFQLDDGDLRMNSGRGKIDIDADDADVEITNAKFESVIADMDDGDLIIETSLIDSGNYRIDAQDGLVAFTVVGGGAEFDVRHDDGDITTSAGFETLQESDDHTQLRLLNGAAKVNIRSDDARVKLASRQ